MIVLDAELRQVDARRLGEVGEVQRVARHAEPDGRLQALDQLELQRRGRRGAGARPVHGDAARRGAARVDLPDRMDAERERDMRALRRARRRRSRRCARSDSRPTSMSLKLRG